MPTFNKRASYQSLAQTPTTRLVANDDDNRSSQRNYGTAPFSSGDATSLNMSPQQQQQQHTNEPSSENENEQAIVTRLVPGGEMPKAQGKLLIRQIASLISTLLIQIGIPLTLYYSLRNSIGVVYALVISGVPALLLVIYEIIREKKFDVLGCIICISFILSAVVSIISGDERSALVRDQAVGAIVGVMFLVTLLPIRTRWLSLRPFTFIMATQTYPGVNYEWTDCQGNLQQQGILEWQWQHISFFRISMYAQTGAWGVVLIMQLVICVLMVLSKLSTDIIVMYNNIISLVAILSMIALSIVAGIHAQKLVKVIGKKWTEENDFTDKLKSQEGQGQQLL